MSEEEKKAIEIMTKVRDKNIHTFVDELTTILNLIEKQNEKIEQLKKQNEDLYEDNIVYHNIMMKQNRREYRSKFLKEFQEEYGINSYPDYDEIYKRYYNLKNNSIPKSVIKEKIEEYRKERNKLADGCFFDRAENANEDTSLFIAGEVLKELLGGSNE